MDFIDKIVSGKTRNSHISYCGEKRQKWEEQRNFSIELLQENATGPLFHKVGTRIELDTTRATIACKMNRAPLSFLVGATQVFCTIEILRIAK